MKNNSYFISLGGDPEFVVTNNDVPVSAIDILKHNKYNPIDVGNGVNFYYDNVLCEATVVPASTKGGLIKTYHNTLFGISKFLKNKSDGKNKYKILTKSAHHFAPEQLNHEDARELGCDPSYDAHLLKRNEMPECPPTLRVAGAHIHLSRSDYKLHECHDTIPLLDPYSKADVIKMMDIFVGLSLAIIDKDPTSKERRQLYGGASSFRPCPYGVEYRTPSNYWLNDPILVGLIFDLSHFAVSEVLSGTQEKWFEKFDKNKVIKAINENDPNKASVLIEGNLPDKFLKEIFVHAEKEYKDLYKAWKL